MLKKGILKFNLKVPVIGFDAWKSAVQDFLGSQATAIIRIRQYLNKLGVITKHVRIMRPFKSRTK